MTTEIELTTASSSITPCRLRYARIIQNFHLVWLDRTVDETNDDCSKSITKLREAANIVNIFADVDECIDFITDIPETAFIIISEEFTHDIIRIVGDISQVHSIYIHNDKNVPYNKSTEKSHKVAGASTDITSICEALKEATTEYDHNSISISYVLKSNDTTTQKLDQLDPSFMYTQILKEILLTIDFEPVHFNDFIKHYREKIASTDSDLRKIENIEKEYYHREPIWWYTSEPLLYSILNRALREMEADLIVNTGFFVRDLHNQIAGLHKEQYGKLNHSNPFTVYRGQKMFKTEFDKLRKTQGGLMSFNNFLSTSLDRAVSLSFAKSNQTNRDFLGVLFEIHIDPSISSTPFANVKDISRFDDEEEILFSMHSIFRIEQVIQIEENDHLWEVKLTLTSDTDPELHEVMKVMRDETKGFNGWFRLGRVMMKVAYFDKAQQLFEVLLDGAPDEERKCGIYHYLGSIKNNQGNYTESIQYNRKALEILEKTLPTNHPDLAASNNNIGSVYDNMGEYSKALSYHEKALEIFQKALPANHPDLANCYNQIGLVYDNMGKYSKALSYYEKALEILEKMFPATHPDLAASNNNIGSVYYRMGEYSKALSYYEKALEISQKTLPANHPSLATSYGNIGSVYNHMGEYSKALSYYEKVLAIQEKTLPTNHPDLATSNNNIGMVYNHMGEYSKALSYNEKALEIFQKTLPANHPDLAASYKNIGMVYEHMGEYSKALSYYQKALAHRAKTLPANHPDLATTNNNIGSVYDHLGECSKALSYYEKALAIQEKTLPANHPYLATSYNNIGMVYKHMGEYSTALSYYEKALEIRRKTLPANHPHLATTNNNIGMVYNHMGEYSKALSYNEKALEIFQKTLPANHPDLATSYKNIGMVYEHMGEYSKALSYYQKALEIHEKTLPVNHPSLAASYNNIGTVYHRIRQYSKAVPYYEHALNIWKRSRVENVRKIDDVKRDIRNCKKKLR